MQFENLNLNLGSFDHYTIIVPNAEHSLSFHTKILGFKHIDTKKLKLNDNDQRDFDAINYILSLPGDREKTCVITQSLKNGSIFEKLLKKYGEGIHHVAYQSNNIQDTFNMLIKNDIPLTSDTIMKDPINGLSQFFIDRCHAGYFIEVIERHNKTAAPEIFTENNMRGLANTMNKYC